MITNSVIFGLIVFVITFSHIFVVFSEDWGTFHNHKFKYAMISVFISFVISISIVMFAEFTTAYLCER